MRNITKSLEEAFEFYIRFKGKNIYGSCLSYISDIYHSTTYCKEYGKGKEIWIDVISKENLDEKFYTQAFKEYFESYKRIKHIISVGDSWIGEEWILILVHRLTWEMVKDFFHFRDLPFPDEMDLKGLCEEMKELSQTKKNKRVFDSSVATMQKNSPLPFVDIWFEADRRDEYLSGKHS